MNDFEKPIHEDVLEYSEATKKQHVKNLSLRHRSLMRKLLAGWMLKDAAEELGYTLPRASMVLNSPLFKEEMDRMRVQIDEGVIKLEAEVSHMDGGVKAEMEKQAFDSLKRIIELRDGAQSERVRQVSALEILDRAGYGKTEKSESKIQIESSPGLVNAIQIAVKEMQGGGKK